VKDECKEGDRGFLQLLKLISDIGFSTESLRKSQIDNLRLLKREAGENSFQVSINEMGLQEIEI